MRPSSLTRSPGERTVNEMQDDRLRRLAHLLRAETYRALTVESTGASGVPGVHGLDPRIHVLPLTNGGVEMDFEVAVGSDKSGALVYEAVRVRVEPIPFI